jgi:hypothetical protein
LVGQIPPPLIVEVWAVLLIGGVYAAAGLLLLRPKRRFRSGAAITAICCFW